MALISLVAGLLTLTAVIFLVVYNLTQTKNFQKDITDHVAQMSKEIKRWGDELSKTLGEIGSKNGDSQARIANSIAGLNALEEKLGALVHSLTNTSSQIPEITLLKSQLEEARTFFEKLSHELDAAKAKAQKFEADYENANRRILEMEAAETQRRKERGIEPVAPDRNSIAEATQRATDLAWDRGATPRALLAKKAAEEEGALIMKAFDAASRGEAETAATIVDASAFDPFSFHKDQWNNTVAAKHTLEFARSAAIEGMRMYGFQVDEPRIKIDAYDQNRHDLRDSIPTDNPELKGKIAEVRRLGLLHHGRVVRPARVVQYAIDYRKSAETAPEAKPVAVIPPVEELVTTTAETQETSEKRGLSDF